MPEVRVIQHKILCINPFSGGSKNNSIRKKVIDLAFGRKDVEIRISEHRGDISQFISNNEFLNSDSVYVICGGDGTVQEAASVLKEKNVSMMVVPCGSGDGFATNAGFKAIAIKDILNASIGEKKQVDCYMINQETGVNMCGFGFDAEIAHFFAKEKRRGLAGYIKLITSRLFSSKERTFSVKIGENQFEITTWILGIANGAVMGNGAVVNPGGRIDDGVLELYSIRKPTCLQAVPLLIRLFRGTLSKSAIYQRWNGNTFIIQSPSALAHIDGEPLLSSNGIFKVEICKGAISLLIPKPNEEK